MAILSQYYAHDRFSVPPSAFPQINLFRAQLFTGAGDYFSSGNDLANFLRADSTDTTPAKGS
jgi:hypothetical protein